MIDKNGRLFGKISIVDIIITVLLLAALLFAVNKLGIFKPKQIISGNTDKIRITFYQEEVNTFTVENVKLNDPVTETLQNAGFGNVADVKPDKSVSWGVDKNGRQVKSTKEGFSSVFITTETTGAITPGSIMTGGSTYYVGQLMTIRVGTSVFFARLYAAEKIQEG